MTSAFWIAAYFSACFIYLVAVILITKLLTAKLLKRWSVPNWLPLLLSSVVIGLAMGIISVSFPNGSFRYFINPFGMNLTNAMTYIASSSDYFWVTLGVYTFFGIVFGTNYVYIFRQSSDYWTR